jgi:hypothetical protein
MRIVRDARPDHEEGCRGWFVRTRVGNFHPTPVLVITSSAVAEPKAEPPPEADERSEEDEGAEVLSFSTCPPTPPARRALFYNYVSGYPVLSVSDTPCCPVDIWVGMSVDSCWKCRPS